VDFLDLYPCFKVLLRRITRALLTCWNSGLDPHKNFKEKFIRFLRFNTISAHAEAVLHTGTERLNEVRAIQNDIAAYEHDFSNTRCAIVPRIRLLGLRYRTVSPGKQKFIYGAIKQAQEPKILN
jgi:hypothetical protein